MTAPSAPLMVLDDERWARVRSLTGGAPSTCFQCGTCTASCPILAHKDANYSVRRLLRGAQVGLDGSDRGLWLCTACRYCETHCPRGVDVVEAVMGLRSLAFLEGRAPAEAHKLLWNVLEEGNPGGDPRSRRAAWTNGLGLKDASAGTRVLLYAGCAAYDPRIQRIARSVANLLSAAGVEFGVLGTRERCCGDAVRTTGERGYLEKLIQENVATFAATKADVLVSLSPHCYDIFRNLYPRYGLEAEVLHATEFLARLVDANKLQPKRGDGPRRVVYHDPCYLGRYNGVYEAPRKLLESVPGLELLEFSDHRVNALCCGGGGGGMWRDDSGDRLSDVRYRQGRETGADALATSCPYCVQNFEDGARRLPGPRVLDVVELLAPKEAT